MYLALIIRVHTYSAEWKNFTNNPVTDLPHAFVIEIGTNIDHDYPNENKKWNPCYPCSWKYGPNDRKENNSCHEDVRKFDFGKYIPMTQLINTKHPKYYNHIHVSSIKLEIVARWANMIAGAKNSFQDQRDPDGIKYTKMSSNSQSWVFLIVVIFMTSTIINITNSNHNQESYTQYYVTNIAEDVVEWHELYFYVGDR